MVAREQNPYFPTGAGLERRRQCAVWKLRAGVGGDHNELALDRQTIKDGHRQLAGKPAAVRKKSKIIENKCHSFGLTPLQIAMKYPGVRLKPPSLL